MFRLQDYKQIYMMGIGGISMSGLAYILKNWGFQVRGSDSRPSDMTDKLERDGIPVHIGQCYENITSDIDLVVYSSAIKKENPELVHARQLKIPTLERGAFLGELTKLFKDTIGIAGTHGKTTTTSMVTECFLQAHLDPSVQVGSVLKSIQGNYRIGKSEHFIIEACEYCDSFLHFHQKSAIVLNIDADHLDYFKNVENIQASFQKYVSNLPSDGILVLNADDKRVLALKEYTKANVVTYGFDEKAIYRASNIRYDENGYGSYDLYKDGKWMTRITLSIIGKHNISNSLACIALCDSYHLGMDSIKKALKHYQGAARRFEFKGKYKNANIYDDYGHHPTEIKAVSEAIKNKRYHESWIIFEPLTYSRLKNHKKEFAESLTSFDHVIISDIFASREINTFDISEEDLIHECKLLGKDCIHMSEPKEILAYMANFVQDNDLIITMGPKKTKQIGELLASAN